MHGRSASVTDYLSWIEDVRKLTSATAFVYADTLERFAEYVDHTPWRMVTPGMIESFMARPRRGGKAPSAATMARDRTVLGSFYKFLLAKGEVESDPLLGVGVPKVRNRKPKALTDEQLLAVWSAVADPDDYLWIGLGCFAGLRRREMVGLEVDMIDVDRHHISEVLRKGRIPGDIEYGEGTGAISDKLKQLAPIGREWLDLLQDYEPKRERVGARFLLPWDEPASPKTRLAYGLEDPEMPNPSTLNHRLNPIARRAGVKVDVHTLRHTCATNLFRSGVPAPLIKDYLGHTSLETTMVYLQTSGQLAQWRMG